MTCGKLAIIGASVFLVLAPLVGSAGALERKADRVFVPKGSKVTVSGNIARIRRPGVVVTVNCYCDSAKGTCSAMTTENGVTCYKGPDATCTTTCKASSTTTGATGGGLLRQ